MIWLASLLAFYLAWNLGANDVANSMATSVGSKTLSFRQALILAGILEFCGSVLLGQSVASNLATGLLDISTFAATPERFMVGMFAVLLSCCVWLNLATLQGWPVSSSHAIVGAIAGFGGIAIGWEHLQWQTIGFISLTWILTPLVSGSLAAGLYFGIQQAILWQAQERLQEWIPWLSLITIAVFGSLIAPSLQPLLQTGLDQLDLSLPAHDLVLGLGLIPVMGLTGYGFRQLSSANLEAGWRGFQVCSASFVALAHGANDVGNAIAPLALIVYISQQHQVPLGSFPIPYWLLGLGGCGIVCGLAVLGKNVMQTVGEELTELQPSSGFIAEFVTALTVLIASRWGLPVSTSHAIVGSVLGIGILRDRQGFPLSLLQKIIGAWLITIPLCGALSASLFWVLESLLRLVHALP